VNFALIRKQLSRLSHLNWPFRRLEGHLHLGRRGERVAVRHLKRRHYRIIGRNYRCSLGEIDLIAGDGDTLVFVEVKTRASHQLQDPSETAGPVKWRRVERAARHFLARKAKADGPCRFDLVTVLWPSGGSPVVEHFEDAYQPRGQ